MDKKNSAFGSNLLLAMGLGFLLLALSYLRVWGDAGSAALDGKIIRATLSGPIWGTALAKNLALFVCALLLVHAAFGCLCLGFAHLSHKAWPASKNSLRTWMLLWYLLGAFWILAANASWYPASLMGEPYADLARQNWAGVSPLMAASVAICALAIVALAKALTNLELIGRLPSSRTKAATAGGLAIIVASVLAINEDAAGGSSAASSTRPHVILIGLDSLRVDAAFGETAARNAPAINQFLRESTVFNDAITPLARTFPSWVSILSGRHPHSTGAVINLFPREQIQEGDSLPKLLGKAGYRTVYAIDEVRFSNLDTSYGFDEMISPPMGASDFLLGFFSDSPLANLLVNTRVGAHLFPYSHGNRAISTTYDPDTFVNMLDRNVDFDEPTFLTVHMTLAHWPFTWATSEPRLDSKGAVDPVGLYEQAVARLDRQFKDVIEVLRRQGALDNAIVVVLSDHGESLGERDFALAPASADTDAVRHTIYGHGTNVLSNHQYQVVLGMREFGETPLALKPGTSIDLPVSLEDVAPTLVDVLGIQSSTPFDGVSLVPLLHGHALAGTADFKNRIRYMETEFNPPGVALGQTVTPSALTDAAEFYRIDPDTDRILIREEFMEEILANRQYAASRNGRVLASLPAAGGLDRPLAYLEGPDSAPRWIGAEVGKQAEPELAELRLALESRFPAIQRGASPPAGAAAE